MKPQIYFHKMKNSKISVTIAELRAPRQFAQSVARIGEMLITRLPSLMSEFAILRCGMRDSPLLEPR